jgi:hypothetical protein
VERLRGAGLMGDAVPPGERLRAGALLVLCAWSAFVIAGSAFAKFTEHWARATPRADRAIPSAAFTAVAVAAAIGAALVLAALVVVLPAFFRSLRDGGWAAIRRRVLLTLGVGSATVALGVGVVVWAHHLSPSARNAGFHSYQLVGLIWVLMIIATVSLCSAVAVKATRQLVLTPSVLRLLGLLALALTVVMVVVIGSALTWWGAIAADAPWFFGNGVVGSTAPLAPPLLLGAGILMLLGLAAAVSGAGRVARALARLR